MKLCAFGEKYFERKPNRSGRIQKELGGLAKLLLYLCPEKALPFYFFPNKFGWDTFLTFWDNNDNCNNNEKISIPCKAHNYGCRFLARAEMRCLYIYFTRIAQISNVAKNQNDANKTKKANEKGKAKLCMKKRLFSPILLLFLVFLLLQSGMQTAFAASDAALETAVRPGELLIPGGNAFGIKLFTKGVVVIGVTDVQTASGLTTPAADAGLEVGDVIVEIDGREVNTAEETKALIGACEGRSLSVVYERDGERVSTVLTPQLDAAENEYRGGVWVRDSTAGIGTVTYVNAADGSFGGLGHGICDVETGELLPMLRGVVVDVEITGVEKGRKNDPGELRGSLSPFRCGLLAQNTGVGVFGSFDELPADLGEAIPAAADSEVETGKAYILSTLDGHTREQFEIEITKLSTDTESKNMVLKVTDERLLEKTGGIVQGMSGSPIIQNGRLVGAVTHVMVNDPTRGYGILVSRMLAAAG